MEVKNSVAMGIRMDASTHDELRRIAYENRTSIQKLVMKGIMGVIWNHPPNVRNQDSAHAVASTKRGNDGNE